MKLYRWDDTNRAILSVEVERETANQYRIPRCWAGAHVMTLSKVSGSSHIAVGGGHRFYATPVACASSMISALEFKMRNTEDKIAAVAAALAALEAT